MSKNNIEVKETELSFDNVYSYIRSSIRPKADFYVYRRSSKGEHRQTVCFYHIEDVFKLQNTLQVYEWKYKGDIWGILTYFSKEEEGVEYVIEVVLIKHLLNVNNFIYFAKFIDTFSLNELFHITDELWDKSSNKPSLLYEAFGRFITTMKYGREDANDSHERVVKSIDILLKYFSTKDLYNEMLKSLEYQYLVTRFIQNNIDSNYNNFQYVKGSEKIIAIDFDGTLCDSNYPHCGDYVEGAKEAIEKIHKAGYSIIIWTCRANEALLEAFRWCMNRDIPFDFMNKSHIEIIEKFGGDNRKVFAHHYVDDRNIGGFIGWGKVLEHLGI